MVIQAYAPTSNSKEAEVECFYVDLQDLLELTPKKDITLKDELLRLVGTQYTTAEEWRNNFRENK